MTSRKLAIVLVISFITGMVFMSEIQNFFQEENAVQVSTTMAKRLQQKIISDESTSLTKKQHELSYGQVVRGTDHVIIYNSVPKCGSRTFGDTSRKLFKQQSIDMPRLNLRVDNRRRNQSETLAFIERIEAPAYCQGHGYFVPFDHSPRRVYINFIRDPVSRMVSAFYFNRFGDHGHNRPGRNKELKFTIDDCILSSLDDCIGKGRYSTIFCGFHERCGIDHKWALEQAKSNIDKYYTFIGITEDYEASLRVLEHLMPDMYSGITELYLSLLNTTNSRSTLSKTKLKKPLSQELNDTATERLAVDYELYNYIYDQHRKLKARFGID